MKMKRTYAIILTLTFLLSVVSTAYITASLVPAANAAEKKVTPAPLPKGVKPSQGLKDFVGRQDDATWYKTVEGVLAVPGEMPLYPFEHGTTMSPANTGESSGATANLGDLKVGFSRFGEPIDPLNLASDPRYPKGVGIAYIGEDNAACFEGNGPFTDCVFDPINNPLIDINSIVAGWKLVVVYNRPGSPAPRVLWAFAKFSDTFLAGSPPNGPTGFALPNCANVVDGWIECPYATNMANAPGLTPNGGRKTNAFMVSSPSPEVLYEGARRVILTTTNTMYDPGCAAPPSTSACPVAALTLTLDFNKDMKEVTLIKDVKLLLQPPKEASPLTPTDCFNAEVAAGYPGWAQNPAWAGTAPSGKAGLACFELDNNEELDMGSGIFGFGHFWTIDGGSNCGTPTATTDCPQTTTKILQEPNGQAAFHWDQRAGANNIYAVAQILDTSGEFAVKKAFWPHPDWWTLNAFQGNPNDPTCKTGCTFGKLEGIHDDNTITTGLGPGGSPIVGTAAQWNFILDCSPNAATPCTPTDRPTTGGRGQWRSVEVYGVTGTNDGCVAVAVNIENPCTPSGLFTGNLIDREFQYLDNMIFNPWDLQSAADKAYTRQMALVTCNAPFGNQFCDGSNGNPNGITVTLPGMIDTKTGSRWDAYASFAERVLDITSCPVEDTTPASKEGCPTEFLLRGDNPFLWLAGANSADPEHANYEYNNCNGLTCDGITITDTFGNVPIPNGERFKILYSTAPNDEKLNVFQRAATGANTIGYLQYGPAYNIKFIMGHATGSGDPGTWVPITTYTCSLADGTLLDAGCKYAPSNQPGHTGYQVITNVEIPTTTGDCATTGTSASCDEYKVVYDTPRGNYEWLVIGRDSATVDSAGSAYVSEAFDSLKNIDVQTVGFDMQSPTFPTVPFVLEYFGSPGGSTRPNYTECKPSTVPSCTASPDGTTGTLQNGDTLFELPRAHLRDDWSSIIPVDSSDIILVGGPLANAATQMANDWTSTIYRGLSKQNAVNDFWGPGLWDGIYGHEHFPGSGYATISTYMDIDGTVYFIVYGNTGQDTYWATWLLLHDNGGTTYNNLCNGPQTAAGTATQNPWELGSPVGPGCGLIPMQHENPGVTSWIIHIDYTGEPHIPTFQIEKRLNTFSEKQPEQDP
jgi:hypothetical protein